MLYLFHGPDDFTLSEKLAAMKASLGDDPTTVDMNATQLEGRGLSLGEIRNYSDAMPFMASKRLVIITDYLKHLGKKASELEPLVAYLENLSPTTDLIFAESDKLDKRHPVHKLAEKIGHVEYLGLDAKSLQTWIVRRAKEFGGRIEPSAAAHLGKLVGLDLRVLNSELEKLTLYTNNERPITQADVDLLVPYTEEAERFGLSNAIGARNARQAYDQLQKELDEGRNPMAILGGIAAQIRALIEVKDMAQRGMSPRDIANAKGWRSDFAAKMRLKDASRFSMPRLEQIMDMLLDIDLSIKTGRIDSRLALDVLIAQLCEGGE